MDSEKIKVRVTETGQTLDVVVYSKPADRIEIVLGEGIHNVKCETPTRIAFRKIGHAVNHRARFLGAVLTAVPRASA